MPIPEYAKAYIADQFRNAISQLEVICGRPFDWKKFKEVKDQTQRSVYHWNRIADMAQYKPSPLNGFDLFNYMALIVACRSLDYAEITFKKFADELQAKYEAGQYAFGAAENEKCRVAWEGIVYSNPNNPSWICLKEEELRIIGELATQYDVIVLEDLAYFAMDFRQDLSKPFQAPYQPSVAHYTDYYVLLISGSKAFSYAGQRIGVSCISDKLYHRAYPGLTQRYGGGTFGTVFIHRVLYALSSGTSHSAQYALAAMLKAANEDQYNFLDEVKVYGERARRLKEIFLRHGFHLVYDNDLGDPVADGFYFTIGYPGMSSGELARELMYYGVSAISLVTTGSHQEGLRACTSFIQDHQYDQLDERMAIFAENHPIQ